MNITKISDVPLDIIRSAVIPLVGVKVRTCRYTPFTLVSIGMNVKTVKPRG